MDKLGLLRSGSRQPLPLLTFESAIRTVPFIPVHCGDGDGLGGTGVTEYAAVGCATDAARRGRDKEELRLDVAHLSKVGGQAWECIRVWGVRGNCSRAVGSRSSIVVFDDCEGFAATARFTAKSRLAVRSKEQGLTSSSRWIIWM